MSTQVIKEKKTFLITKLNTSTIIVIINVETTVFQITFFRMPKDRVLLANHAVVAVTKVSLATDATAVPFWDNNGIKARLRVMLINAPPIVQYSSFFSWSNASST